MKDIPITEDWKPNIKKSDSLRKILFEKCKQIESQIIAQVNNEKYYNINNFDSGLPTEKIIRDSIKKLLPKRYKVSKGILCDRDGKTSGEHDIVIFNDFWFPYLTGNEENKEREFFPIEGVYALGEVKQTLTVESLDEGLKKLVMAQRLNRPTAGSNRYTENRKRGDKEIGTGNPLFTFLIAVNYNEEQFSFDDMFNRFFEINKSLYRQEMIRMLCVINRFSFSWATLNPITNEFDVARFTIKDENEPIVPSYRDGRKDDVSSFYDLIMFLSAHLNDCILGSEDIYVAYGNRNSEMKSPPLEKYTLHNY